MLDVELVLVEAPQRWPQRRLSVWPLNGCVGHESLLITPSGNQVSKMVKFGFMPEA